MASDVATVADELVDIINNATLGQSVTAVRTYGSTKELADLGTVRVEVFPLGRSKTRNDRFQLKVVQSYGVNVRRRMAGADLDGDEISDTAMDAWMSFVDELENVAWRGRFTNLGARVETVEISAEYDVEFCKSQSLFAAALIFNVAWYKEYT